MAEHFRSQSFSLPPPMLEDLKREAEAKDLSMSQVLRHYLRFGGLGKQQGSLDLKRGGNVDDSR